MTIEKRLIFFLFFNYLHPNFVLHYCIDLIMQWIVLANTCFWELSWHKQIYRVRIIIFFIHSVSQYYLHNCNYFNVRCGPEPTTTKTPIWCMFFDLLQSNYQWPSQYSVLHWLSILVLKEWFPLENLYVRIGCGSGWVLVFPLVFKTSMRSWKLLGWVQFPHVPAIDNQTSCLSRRLKISSGNYTFVWFLKQKTTND